VFQTPWESRLFGITMALHRAGCFEWDEFRQLLIAEISRSERESDAVGSYYESWRAALEALMSRKGLCGAAELDARTRALFARPPGHDH
jgi:nitrile hydratase accessory protein